MGLKKLSPAQARQFEESGCVFPITALAADEVARYGECLRVLLAREGAALHPSARHSPHLYLKWASDLVHHPQVLDAVEDVLGPDLLVWRSIFFIKPPHDPSYIAWHQDSAYWGLDPDAVVTAWIALTDSTVENGCLRIVAGSHRARDLPHRIQFGGGNILVRGQALEVPEERATNVELQAGQFSIHHERLIHGSLSNRSSGPRVGLAVRYLATRARSRGPRQRAVLVRGSDGYGHFDPDTPPARDYESAALRRHRRAIRRYALELCWDALLRPTPKNLLTAGRIFINRKMLKGIARHLFVRRASVVPRKL